MKECSFESREQVGGEMRFHHEAARARSLCLMNHLIGIVLTDDDYLSAGQMLTDAPCRLQPIHSGHGNVHHNGGGLPLQGEFDGLISVGGLATNRPSRTSRNQILEACADGGVVVNDEDR